MEDFQTQVSELDSQLSHRTRELDTIRAELKAVKDFRRKRAQMQRELDEVSSCLLIFLLCVQMHLHFISRLYVCL